MPMEISILEKYQIIGKALKLSPKESKVFGYKALNWENAEIATEMNQATARISDCVLDICEKLHIKDDPNRDEELQEIAQLWLQHYKLCESIAKGDGHQMIEALHHLNNSR